MTEWMNLPFVWLLWLDWHTSPPAWGLLRCAQRSTPACDCRSPAVEVSWSLLEEELRNEQQGWTVFINPTSHQCQISARTLLSISVCCTSGGAIVQASGSSAGATLHPLNHLQNISKRRNHGRAVTLQPVTGFRGCCAEPTSTGKVGCPPSLQVHYC